MNLSAKTMALSVLKLEWPEPMDPDEPEPEEPKYDV
jgi:hypothetical protein